MKNVFGWILFAVVAGILAFTLGLAFSQMPPNMKFNWQGAMFVCVVFVVGIWWSLSSIHHQKSEADDWGTTLTLPMVIYGGSCAIIGIVLASSGLRDDLTALFTLYKNADEVAINGLERPPVNSDPNRSEAPRVAIGPDGKLAIAIPPDSGGKDQELGSVTIRYTVPTLADANTIVIPKEAVAWKRFVWYQTKEGKESFAERF